MARVTVRGQRVRVEDLCAALDEMIAWACDIRRVLCSASPGSTLLVKGFAQKPGEAEVPRYYASCPPPVSGGKKPKSPCAPVRTPRRKRA
jgi:hypothetical protein